MLQRFADLLVIVLGLGLIAEYWREIGIRAHMNIALRDIIWPRHLNGEYEVHHWYQVGTDFPNR